MSKELTYIVLISYHGEEDLLKIFHFNNFLTFFLLNSVDFMHERKYLYKESFTEKTVFIKIIWSHVYLPE